MQRKSEHKAKIRVVVYGAVQGVSYRRWLKRLALARGVDGWVRNRNNGTVEAVLAGSSDKVGSTLLRCSDGPNWATVESIYVEPYDADVALGFRIRPWKRLPVTQGTIWNYVKEPARKIRREWKAYLKRKSIFAAYRDWREQNPALDFKHYYVETIARYLDGRERSHRTLGPQPRSPGKRLLRRLVALGLKPGDVVVDYGCGTLREGVYFIRYLDAGKFIGLDIDQRILDAGRRLCGTALLSEKTPALCVIDAESLGRAAAARPDWVVSSEVLQHVPPQEIDRYLANLSDLIKAHGRAVIQAPFAKRTVQYSPTAWHHGQSRFLRSLARRGLAVQVKTRKINSKVTRVQMIVAAKSLPRIVPESQPESLAQ